MYLEQENEISLAYEPQTITPPEVKNNTKSRFTATFFNDVQTDAIIQTFMVNIFNTTNTTVPESSYEYKFPTERAIEEVIKPLQSKTQSIDIKLSFSELDSQYTVQIRYYYLLSTNRSEILFVNAPSNFSLAVIPNDIEPPEFILLLWYGVTILFIAHVSFGLYGNRRKKE
jgi:hypothetical protein